MPNVTALKTVQLKKVRIGTESRDDNDSWVYPLYSFKKCLFNSYSKCYSFRTSKR